MRSEPNPTTSLLQHYVIPTSRYILIAQPNPPVTELAEARRIVRWLGLQN